MVSFLLINKCVRVLVLVRCEKCFYFVFCYLFISQSVTQLSTVCVLCFHILWLTIDGFCLSFYRNRLITRAELIPHFFSLSTRVY